LNVKGEDDFWQAAYLAIFSLITEVIPVFIVVDGSFVKIFSAEHLETTIDAETSALVTHFSKETSLQEDTLVISDAKDSTVSSSKYQLLNTNNKLGVTTETNITYMMS
jgi:hypothetical protein